MDEAGPFGSVVGTPSVSNAKILRRGAWGGAVWMKSQAGVERAEEGDECEAAGVQCHVSR